MERRALGTKVRAGEGDKGKVIEGYAAIFGSLSEPIGGLARGGFKEKIAPTAFNACLAANPDIRCLNNHDVSQILGRTKAGTLKLAVNNVGLRYSCELPSSQIGNSVWESVRRGDVSGSSFGFEAEDDSWDDRGIRTLRQVKLFDVGPAVFPAYPSSTVSIRSLSGSMSVQLGWYRAAAGKLRLPLLSEKEMRARVKSLQRQMMGDGMMDDADGDGDECTCPCSACEADDDINCDCDGCASMTCESDSADCHCAGRREVKGRMKPVTQGRTLYSVDREAIQKSMQLEAEIFRARQARWRR